MGFLWSLVQSAPWVQAPGPSQRARSPGGVRQSIFLSSFCFVKKIAIFLCPFLWPLRMASPPPLGARGQGHRGGEGVGCRAVVAGEASGSRSRPLLDAPEETHGKDHGEKLQRKSKLACQAGLPALRWAVPPRWEAAIGRGTGRGPTHHSAHSCSRGS